jgi:hypothetical protein
LPSHHKSHHNFPVQKIFSSVLFPWFDCGGGGFCGGTGGLFGGVGFCCFFKLIISCSNCLIWASNLLFWSELVSWASCFLASANWF